MTQTTCTETSTGTLTRIGYSDRISGTIPFENGHVTHLDLAAVHPRSNHSHLHSSDHFDTSGNGGFLSSSLSAAALNQSSCAVPMIDMSQRTLPHNLVHSSSLGWGSNGGTSGRVRYQHHLHQEECPHFSGGLKEAPT